LGAIKDSRAIGPLVVALKGPEASVRQSAAAALGSIGPPALDPLIAALKEPQSDVRQGAAFALGELKDVRALAPLKAALNDPDPAVREAAAKAIQQTPERIVSQLPFTIEGLAVVKGGQFSTDNEAYITRSSGMYVKALYLGKLPIPLQSTSISSDMMLSTRDYGNVQIKFNWYANLLLVLVTPEQEEQFKRLCAQSGCQRPES
jgi:hypothetical protein